MDCGAIRCDRRGQLLSDWSLIFHEGSKMYQVLPVCPERVSYCYPGLLLDWIPPELIVQRPAAKHDPDEGRSELRSRSAIACFLPPPSITFRSAATLRVVATAHRLFYSLRPSTRHRQPGSSRVGRARLLAAISRGERESAVYSSFQSVFPTLPCSFLRASVLGGCLRLERLLARPPSTLQSTCECESVRTTRRASSLNKTAELKKSENPPALAQFRWHELAKRRPARRTSEQSWLPRISFSIRIMYLYVRMVSGDC